MTRPALLNTLQRYQNTLKRSSAIQQGLLNLSIFLLCLFLLSVVTYFFVQDALSSRLDSTLQQRMSLLQAANEKQSPSPYQPLHQSIQGNDFALVLRKQDLAQRQYRHFRHSGFSTQEIEHNHHHDDETRYRILVSQQAGQVLVVASNNDNDQEILEIVLKAFMLNGLIALVLTALLVLYLANRSHRQIRRIEHVLQHAAQGELHQRIGASSKQDDLAHVSTQIDTMLSRLETSMTAMTDISANIAHELKTPISRLRHDLITALDQQESGDDITLALNAAFDESSYITETFDALLRIAQIEGGARRANFTTLNLHSLIDTVMDIYTDVAEDAGMQLRLGTVCAAQATQPASLQGDRELLIQMLANLIENAIRYCPSGTTITIDCTQQQEQLSLSVADNGLGIPASEREQVFQRLYRVDKSRSDQRGTGLGLSLVKAIVELHHASITLTDNQPGLRAVIRF